MVNRKSCNIFIVALLLAAVPFAFNACGRGFQSLGTTSEDLSSILSLQKICEKKLIDSYATTYHPIMKTNCNTCHGNAHGSADVNISFNAFQSKGKTLIDYQATHPHGGNSINLTNEIAAIQPAWQAATDQFNSCVSQNPDQQQSSGLTFKLSGKGLTGITSNFKEFAWDLYKESPNRVGQIQATFKVEARLYMYQNAVVGFEFRNPSVQLASGQADILVEGLQFTVNDQLQTSETTYSRISDTVSGTTKTMLAPDLGTAFVYVNAASATTLIGVQFKNLK